MRLRRWLPALLLCALPALGQGDEAALLELLQQDDLDPTMQQIMLLQAMGVDGEEAMFMTLLGGGQAAEPEILEYGDYLVIIENGMVYRVNAATMERAGQVRYRPNRLQALAPHMMGMFGMMGAMGGAMDGPPPMAAEMAVPAAPAEPAPPPPPPVAAAAPAAAAPPAAEAPAVPEALADDPDVLLMLELAGGGNAEQLLPMLMMRPASPVSARIKGDLLLIVEGGTLYRVNLRTMELAGKLRFRGGAGGQAMVDQLRHRARASQSMANLKQLAMGVMMYANDHENTLPGEDIVDEIGPYLRNEQLWRSPAWENQDGYVLNEAVIGLPMGEIADPSRTVLLFETPDAADTAVGSVANVPDEGPWDGRLMVAFADGHVEKLTPDELRTRLEAP